MPEKEFISYSCVVMIKLTVEEQFSDANSNLHISFLAMFCLNFLIMMLKRKPFIQYVLISFFAFQVKVKRWVDGVEKEAIGGLTADFGSVLPAHAEEGHRFLAVFADPLNGCSLSSSNVFL